MGVEVTERIHAGDILDAIAIAVIVTDQEARLIYSNAAADRLLRRRGGALHCYGGKVGTTRPGTQGKLPTIIALACGASTGSTPGGNYLLAEASNFDEPALALCVVPIRDGAGDARTNAMVLLRPIERDCNVEIEARRLFGLTRKEAKFASAIASGLSLLEAATSDGVTLATARSHLKSIFRKTGLSRQSQVAALLRGAQLPIASG